MTRRRSLITGRSGVGRVRKAAALREARACRAAEAELLAGEKFRLDEMLDPRELPRIIADPKDEP